MSTQSFWYQNEHAAAIFLDYTIFSKKAYIYAKNCQIDLQTWYVVKLDVAIILQSKSELDLGIVFSKIDYYYIILYHGKIFRH
jgi:hypothetical protein